MTEHAPFAVRILAEVARMAAWPVRGFLAAVGADPMPAFAFGVLLIVVTLSLAPALKTLLVAERWIARHVAAHHKQRETDAFNTIVEHFDATADDPMEQLDGVVWIQPRPVPLPRRELHRRLRRFPRRPMRRPTSTSNSDRRTP
jgi:hypothetical protein